MTSPDEDARSAYDFHMALIRLGLELPTVERYAIAFIQNLALRRLPDEPEPNTSPKPRLVKSPKKID